MGALQLTESKYLLYTSYTFCTLDLNQQVGPEVDVLQNHPTRAIEGKQFQAQSWFDNLKVSQAKYLGQKSRLQATTPHSEPSQPNLAINNLFKGILRMEYTQAGDQKLLRVYEHSWRQAIENFQSGAFVQKKFGQ